MTRIYVIGEINHESYLEFSKSLAEAELTTSDPDAEDVDVTVELSSFGGHGQVAMAFYDRIKASPLFISVVCVGAAESAAVLILAAGDRRYMAKNSSCYFHEDTLEIEMAEGPTTSSVLAYAERQEEMEEHWCSILASDSNVSASNWREMHKSGTRLSAEECLACGLIEKIGFI